MRYLTLQHAINELQVATAPCYKSSTALYEDIQLTTNIKWKKTLRDVLLAVNTQGVKVQRKRFALFGPHSARNTHTLNRFVVFGERNVGCAVNKSAHARQNKDSVTPELTWCEQVFEPRIVHAPKSAGQQRA